MADYQSMQGGYTPFDQYGAQFGWDDVDELDAALAQADQPPLRKLLNVVGSVASIALVAGVMTWGYNTIVRDVSGIPVVAASKEPVRVQPENPGGQLTANIGLSVNEVIAEGANDAPVAQVTLAPDPQSVTEEDAPLAQMAAFEAEALEAEALENMQVEQAVAIVPQPAIEATQPEAVITNASLDTEDGIMALANQLAMNVTPLSALDLSDVAEVQTSVTDARTETANAVTGGIAESVRPKQRPAGVRLASTSASDMVAAQPVANAARELDPATLGSGTRLVQLGAYESADVARSEWSKISGQYAEFFTGKDRVIERAESGGRVFYRLRVHGFADLSDARRFCSVLVSGKDDCIPVVVR